MREKIESLLDELITHPPKVVEPSDIAETVDFLRWIKDDNFTFLGCRDYKLIDYIILLRKCLYECNNYLIKNQPSISNQSQTNNSLKDIDYLKELYILINNGDFDSKQYFIDNQQKLTHLLNAEEYSIIQESLMLYDFSKAIEILKNKIGGDSHV